MLKGILVDDQLTKTCSHSIVDRYLSNNECIKYQPEILPRERSDKSLNALKVSAEVCIPSSNISFLSEFDCCDMPVATDHFLQMQYFRKGTFVLTETFSTCQVSVDLFRYKMSGRCFIF